MGAIAFTLESYLDAYQLAALLMGAFAVELLASKSGLRWDETSSRKPQHNAAILLVGFGLGAAAALLLVGIAALAGIATVKLGAPTLVGLGMGLALPLAQAARDELLFRGAPLAMMRDRIPDRYAIPFVALLGGAPMLLVPDRSPLGIATVILAGSVFALAWRIGKGAFLPWGAHAGWLFMLGAGSRGAVLDVSFGAGSLLPFVRADGAVAWLALFVVAALAAGAVILWRRVTTERAAGGTRSAT